MKSSYPPPPPRFFKATNERPQEDDRDNVARPPTTAAARKKGIGVRAWLLMDSTGQSQVVEAGKHAIMCRTGLPARDLRILDPLLSYPSTVLGRERAIVINLEHIKAIVTSQEVLLLNSKDPSVAPFVEELERRLMGRRQAIKAQEGNGTGSETCLCDPAEIQSQVAGPINFPRDHDKGGNPSGKPGLDNRDGNKVLPFEFVALEACLEAACSCLENEANMLEQEAQTALDKLTSKISTLNLERVRQIKSRLVAITGRAQKVRDDLEHLLDDDEDMAEMYLTEKLVQQHLENSSDLPLNERDDIYDDDFQPELDDSIPAEVSLRAYGADRYEIDNGNADTLHDHPSNMPRALIGDNHVAHTSTTRSVINKQFGVGELEMLLEAYFVQIDGTLNKLSTLKEYVDDTEDYINIMLDDKQNQLLKMAVVLTTGTLIVSCFVVTTGVFGMNIHIELFNEGGSVGMHKWLWTTFGGTAACIFAYVSAISWFKYKRLIE